MISKLGTVYRKTVGMRRKLLGRHPGMANLLCLECLAIRGKRLPEGSETFDSRSLLGASLLGQKNHA
jgi:hypothetical protein